MSYDDENVVPFPTERVKPARRIRRASCDCGRTVIEATEGCGMSVKCVDCHTAAFLAVDG